MTVEELVHALVFVLCLAACSVILPVGLIISSAPLSPTTPGDTSASPVFLFEDGY
jgi:hypothetical protein